MDEFTLKSRRLSGYLRVVACIGFTGLVILSLLTMVDGVSRWLSLPRIPGFLDISEVVYAIVITSCFPALLIRDHNVTIRFLGKAVGGRTNYWLEFFGNVLTLAFFTILVWQFYLLTLDLQANNRVSPTLEFPIAPWWWITSIIMTITVPVQVLVVFDSLYSAIFGVASRLPKDEAEGV
ncbi:MAG: TRAP transporter small permease subunit [Rhodospirillaceae bacterium]|jgi:TRAP-type C4-dicarboxylate transport system permease small subunit|nr:TRAP transporter small permease subunit [Rhodospirillaceae bacterium]MBT3886475.1 TRAP transporter small permease subunit [Rhodospirillaceae bacterium]MBT4117938.1 TRAP transporter small permease subunit [Rhodospirillaceae bacterium]MBT4671588.1 TRAP transporter small permease subunit [Rhodospirillaceae bacterium]MBT4719816.1 TRAP transporter small permease subunit [Rhodospirillaceae bacterium]